MYEEWLSIEEEVLDMEKCRSVLHTYPSNVGKDVAKSVIASLCLNSGHSPTGDNFLDSPSTKLPELTTITQINWTMEVVCFGLTLTLTEFETLKDSVLIYLEWLTVGSNVGPNVPLPIRNDPLPFLRKMIGHLENLFIPRKEGTSGNQLALCHAVLASVENLAAKSTILDRLTWESLLKFVLKVSDTILAPPCLANGLADQICDRLMQAFFNIWMLACKTSFPSPSFWKTCRLMFGRWRHHLAVVEWWSRLAAATTSRALKFMHEAALPELKIPEEDAKLIPQDMTHEVLVQSWFRILHMIGDPTELWNRYDVIKSIQEDNLPPEVFEAPDVYHSFSKSLPLIFLKAMKGVSTIVDAFLGVDDDSRFHVVYPSVTSQVSSHPITPTAQRKSSKPKKYQSGNPLKPSPTVAALSSSSAGTGGPISHSPVTNQVNLYCGVGDTMEMKLAPNKNRSQCNSLLHLFGEWLFNAALAGSSINVDKAMSDKRQRSTSSQPHQYTTQTSTSSGLDATLISNPLFEVDPKDCAEAGRAEACGALCRIFLSKKSGEEIKPVYLSRFYLVLSEGLCGDSKQVIASILLNSVDLLRIDLPGVTVLLPTIISALETILPDRELSSYKSFVNVVHIRRSAIHLLISMLPLSLHYGDVDIENLSDVSLTSPTPPTSPTSFAGSGHHSFDSGQPSVTVTKQQQQQQQTFKSIRRRILDLLTGALQTETDPINTQMILASLLLSLQDSATFESSISKEEKGKQGGNPSPKSSDRTLPIETPSGLFIQIILLVTRKLEAWKFDITISLAALELLSGLAKTKVEGAVEDAAEECMRAVHQLCQYITSQCERPRPQHKRELHSMIVTAFHTLGVWLVEHPYLMEDKDCLLQVLEIIELGISGSKSIHVDPETNKNTKVMKGEKTLNPVSKRVREAAESLLILMFEYLGAFPSPTSPTSTCSMLDERTLLQCSGVVDHDVDEMSLQQAISHYRYFGLSNGILIGLLEHENNNDSTPSVSMILRSSTGRKVWTFQLRQTPRSDKSIPSTYLKPYSRPSPMPEGTIKYAKQRPRVFPEEVDRIPLVKADCSIPLLRDVPNETQSSQIDKLNGLINEQAVYEDEISKGVTESEMPGSVAPSPVKSYQAARMLLSHLNFLSLDSIKSKPSQSPNHNEPGPFSVMINEKDVSFAADLDNFDSIPTRVHDTAFVFYVKPGQTSKSSILSNMSAEGSSGLQPAFVEFLLSLGWAVNRNTHPGWCGKQSDFNGNIIPQTPVNDEVDLGKEGLGILNGDEYLLYHADASTEVAFIVPTVSRQQQQQTSVTTTAQTNTTSEAAATPPQQSDNISTASMDNIIVMTPLDKTKMSLEFIDGANCTVPQLESPSSPSTTRSKKMSSTNKPFSTALVDSRIAIFWCESYDSIEDIDVSSFEPYMCTHEDFHQYQAKRDIPAIFIHPLDSGLFKVRVKQPNISNKCNFAIPVISGSVISRRSLGSVVRMTLMNICSRHRLAADYSSPHVRRKQRLSDLINKYQHKCIPPDFYTLIFDPCHRENNVTTTLTVNS